MAEYTFNLNQVKGATVDKDSASTFTVKGPAGLTQEQAFEIFKKQVDTGALVGFKPGESLSAATQAADGLPSAAATLTQAQAGSSGIGALISGASSAIAAAGGAIGGSLASSSYGLTGTVGPAVSAISGAVGSGVNAAITSVTNIAKQGSALVKSAIAQGSVAVSSIQTINNTITARPVTNPITTADFTKVTAGVVSGPAVSGIGPMGVPEVNGVLAQAKNLVGQSSSSISNTKGLGEFGLSISQLETAGYVKPGTKALLSTGANLFTSVAKSPAIWTGKDGIKSASDLLSSPGKQSLIQQDLMTKGVAGLAAVGVPVKNLSSQGLAGMSLNAAKDLPSAEAFVKGLPIPGDSTGAIQAAFANAVRDGAFAVNLVNTKIPTAFKQEDIPVPATNTVGRATVDAASSRVIGNDKVPPPNYGPTQKTEDSALVSEYQSKATIWFDQYINPAVVGLRSVLEKISALQNQQSISQQEYDAINNEFQSVRLAYNVKGPSLASELISIYNRLTPTQQKTIDASDTGTTAVSSALKTIVELGQQIGQQLRQLSLKIEGRGANE